MILFELIKRTLDLLKVDFRNLCVKLVRVFLGSAYEMLSDSHPENCLFLLCGYEHVEVAIGGEVNPLDAALCMLSRYLVVDNTLTVGKISDFEVQVTVCISEKRPSESFALATIGGLKILGAQRIVQYLPAQKLLVIANGRNTEHFLALPVKFDNLSNLNIATAWDFCVAEIFCLIQFQSSKLQTSLLFLVHAEKELIVASLEALSDNTGRHGHLEISFLHFLARHDLYLICLHLGLNYCSISIFLESRENVAPEALALILLDLEKD